MERPGNDFADEPAYTSEPDLEEGAGGPDDPHRFVADPHVAEEDEGPDDSVPRTHGGPMAPAIPTPPNDLDGPEPEPPHLELGSPRDGSYPRDDPSPNVP
jgi:hypothetical protein